MFEIIAIVVGLHALALIMAVAIVKIELKYKKQWDWFFNKYEFPLTMLVVIGIVAFVFGGLFVVAYIGS